MLLLFFWEDEVADSATLSRSIWTLVDKQQKFEGRLLKGIYFGEFHKETKVAKWNHHQILKFGIVSKGNFLESQNSSVVIWNLL